MLPAQVPAQAIKINFLLQQGKLTCIIVYKIKYVMGYFIVTKDVAKIGIFGDIKTRPWFLFLFFV